MNNRGFSILELSLALIIMASIIIAINKMSSENLNDLRNRAVIEKIRSIGEAAKIYLKAYHHDLLLETELGPIKINIIGEDFNEKLPSIEGSGLLPIGFNNINPYRQSHSLIIRKSSEDILEALVVTHDGNNISNRDLTKIANKIGEEGGFIADFKPYDKNRINGSFASWNSPISNWKVSGFIPASGNLALIITSHKEDIIGDYISRKKIKNLPEANTISTDLDMGSNNINNINNFFANEAFASNDLNSSNDMVVKEELRIKGNLNASDNIEAQKEILSETSSTSKIFIDKDNSSYYLDPSSISKINKLSANNISVENNGNIENVFARNTSSANVNANSLHTNQIILKDNQGNSQCLKAQKSFTCKYGPFTWNKKTSHCCDGHAHDGGNFSYYSYNLISDPSRNNCWSGGVKVWEGYRFVNC